MTTLAAPYPTARQAVDAAKAQPGCRAVRLDGMNLVLDEAAAHELEADGVAFAYLCWCRANDRIVTVPVNERRAPSGRY